MTDEIKQQYLKSIIESILFISEKPVTLDQFREVMDNVGHAEVRALIAEMMKEYDGTNRGMVIAEIAGGYQMLSNPRYAVHVRNFFKKRVKEKLSKPALETLAIVAYKQPVSRGDIELIRGVNSDGVVAHLSDKALIKIVGRRDVPGRPYLYGTTKLFLEYFGLKALQDMPKLEEFPALAAQAEAGEDGGDLIHRRRPEDMMEHDESQELAPADRAEVHEELNEEGPAQTVPNEDQRVEETQEEKELGEFSDEESGPDLKETNDHRDSESSDAVKAQATSQEQQDDGSIEDASDLKKAMDEINREEGAINAGAPKTEDQ